MPRGVINCYRLMASRYGETGGGDWNAIPGYDGKRRGTRPDHPVETKAANLLRGVDEQLELALKLASQPPDYKKN